MPYPLPDSDKGLLIYWTLECGCGLLLGSSEWASNEKGPVLFYWRLWGWTEFDSMGECALIWWLWLLVRD